MADSAQWARMVVASPDGTRLVISLTGDGPPDLAVVEALARFRLMARRAGDRVWLEDVSAALGDLLDLAGLRQAMTETPARSQAATPAGDRAGRKPGTGARCPGRS